jgi:hypothetical protein
VKNDKFVNMSPRVRSERLYVLVKSISSGACEKYIVVIHGYDLCRDGNGSGRVITHPSTKRIRVKIYIRTRTRG